MTARRLWLSGVLLLAASVASAFEPFEATPSTEPIGGAFYRHLAHEFDLDLRELVKLEKRGFGRNEVVTLVLISSHTAVSPKEYAKRRLKDKVLLRDLAAEAGMDYDDLRGEAQKIKLRIEAKGTNDLPPPVFEPSPTPNDRRRRKKSRDPEEAQSAPSPTPQEPQ